MIELTLLMLPAPTAPPVSFLSTPTISIEVVAWGANDLQFVSNSSDFSGITSVIKAGGPHLFNTAAQRLIEHVITRHALLTKIESFSRLPTDWAGNETVLVSVDTVKAAKALVMGLSYDQALPQVSPSDDGEVGFIWYRNNFRIEALLDPENHLVWFWSKDGSVNAGGEQLFDGSFPDELLNMLQI